MDLWECYFSKNGKVTWRTLGNDCILLHLKSGIYYTLNEEGRLFWESLDGKKKLAEIQEIIMDQYEVDAETLRKDLIEMIQDMIQEDLVEFDETPRIDPSVS
jgi:uncharacterized protein YfeS